MGRLHTGTAGISGTDYMPQIPEPDKAAMEFLYENAILGTGVIDFSRHILCVVLLSTGFFSSPLYGSRIYLAFW